MAERETELREIIFSELFVKAVKLCVENNLCNTVFLQKELCIGYGKAIAMIHAMEALNLVEAFHITGNKNRKVLPTATDFLLHTEQQTLEIFLKEILLDYAKVAEFAEGLL